MATWFDESRLDDEATPLRSCAIEIRSRGTSPGVGRGPCAIVERCRARRRDGRQGLAGRNALAWKRFDP